ncbi:hypothetical protein AGMMS49525_11650 [Bacteroidia bacterium]|nr:hypothetical protein AGMMS49525_11650 [Bacteroidia bacterium]
MVLNPLSIAISLMGISTPSRLEKDEKGTPPPCYCHFPEYGEHYFRGLTAEEQVTKIIKGYQKTYWQKVYDRNEPLDCRIYARAASIIVGIDRFPEDKLKSMAGTSTPAKSRRTTESDEENYTPQSRERKRRRSEFWDR